MANYQEGLVKLLNRRLAPHGAVSEFCRKGKFNRSTVEKWLAGSASPSVESLEKIARALDTEPWKLLMDAGATLGEIHGDLGVQPPEPAKSLAIAPIPGWDVLGQELRELAQGDAAELVSQWLDTLRLFKAALERQKLGDSAGQGESDEG